MGRKNALLQFLFAGCLCASLPLTGCSDSDRSSSDGPKPVPKINDVSTVELAFDSSKDGVPDVFEDLYDGKAYFDLYEFPDVELSKGNLKADTDLGVIQTPARVRSYVHRAYETEKPYEAEDGTTKYTTAVERVPDVHAFALKGGVPYTIEFQDPNCIGGYALPFVPDLDIVTLSNYQAGNTVDALPYDSCYQDEAGRSYAFTFTPEHDGTYCICVANSDTEIDDAPQPGQEYSYAVYADPDKVGHNVRYVIKTDEGEERELSPNDVQTLRADLAPYVVLDPDKLLPSGIIPGEIFGQGAEDVFTTLCDVILSGSQAEENTDSAPGDNSVVRDLGAGARSSLSPVVANYIWDDDVTGMGFGISALNGLPAEKVQAVEAWTEPSDERACQETTMIKFVDNATDHEETLGLNVNGAFAGSTVKVTGKFAKERKIKYSENCATLVVKYVYDEVQPRVLSQLSDYQLTADARTYLKTKGEDACRKRYGDYFVAGATYGADFYGLLTIKTTSREELSKVKASINLKISKFSSDAEIAKALKDTLKNTSIEYKIVKRGGALMGADENAGDTVVSDSPSDAIDKVFSELASFCTGVKTSQKVRLSSYLVGFNQIGGGESLSGYINVSPDRFRDLRYINRRYLAAKAITDAYTSNPTNYFKDSTTHFADVQGRVDDYAQSMRDNTPAMLKDGNLVTRMKAEVEQLSRDASERNERYNFVVLLNSLSANMASGSNSKYLIEGTWGYDNYPLSTAVNNDITEKSGLKTHVQTYKFAKRVYWNPTFGQKPGKRFCYWKFMKRAGSDVTTVDTDFLKWNTYPIIPRLESVSATCQSNRTRGLFLSYAYCMFDDSKYAPYVFPY